MCFPVSASHWIYWCLVVWLLLCSVFFFSSLLKFNLSLFKQSTEKNNKNIQQTGTLITNFSLIQAKFFLQSHLPVRIFNPMRWSILHVCPFYFLFSAGPCICHGYVYACLCVTCIISAIKFLVIKSFMAHLPFFKYRPDRYIVSPTLCLSVMFFLLIISNNKKLFFFSVHFFHFIEKSLSFRSFDSYSLFSCMSYGCFHHMFFYFYCINPIGIRK